MDTTGFTEALSLHFGDKEKLRKTTERLIKQYKAIPDKTDKVRRRLKKYEFWKILLDRDILDRIDNIVIGGTASDDKWVESADLDGEPMSCEQIQELTDDQHYNLILKYHGI